MFDLPFLIAVRKYAYILIYLLMLVPLLNFVVYIGLKIFLGIKGRKLAADSDMFANKEEMEGFMKGFDWAGKVLFFVALAVFLLGILLTIVFGVSAMNAVPDAGFSG